MNIHRDGIRFHVSHRFSWVGSSRILVLALVLFWVAPSMGGDICDDQSCGPDYQTIGRLLFIPSSVDELQHLLDEALRHAAIKLNPRNEDPQIRATMVTPLFPELLQGEPETPAEERLAGTVRFSIEELGDLDVQALLAMLALHPAFDVVELDTPVKLDEAPGARDQAEGLARKGSTWWEFDTMKLDTRWIDPNNQPSYKPVIAVIDSGLDTSHPAFNQLNVVDARDWTGESIIRPTHDFLGHGTHCTGIIGASYNSHHHRPGMVSWGNFITLKVFNRFGQACVSEVAQAIVHARNNGADVLSMSFSLNRDVGVLRDALEYAEDSVVLVASAGNDGLSIRESRAYPAAYSNVVGVHAIGCDGNLAWFSNYGYDMNMPGKAIESTIPGGNYLVWSGTSMAAPFAAGLAALLKSYFPVLSSRETSEILKLCGGDAKIAFNLANGGSPKRALASDRREQARRPETSTKGDGSDLIEAIFIDGRWVDPFKEPIILDEGYHDIRVYFNEPMDIEQNLRVSLGDAGFAHKFGFVGEWQDKYLWMGRILVSYWVDWGPKTIRVGNGTTLSGYLIDRYCGEGVETRPNSPSSHANSSEDETSLDGIVFEDRNCDSGKIYELLDPWAWHGILGYRLYLANHPGGPYYLYDPQTIFDPVLPRVDARYVKIKLVHQEYGEIEPGPEPLVIRRK